MFDSPLLMPVAALCGYLLGSIPFGLVLTRLAGLGDLRQTGSGNIGATNVLRTGNKFLAFLTLVLDAGKGAAAVAGLVYFNPFSDIDILGQTELAICVGLGAILGHNFPVWLKFKGGKGVATTLGTLLAATPMVGVGACVIWLLSAVLFRYSSLSALLALASAPLFAAYYHGATACCLTLIIATVGWIRHKDNIKRLRTGQEPKIGKKK